MSTAADPIPTTVIGGFLGAGKTTLLRRWLARTQQRLAVLVNDFGALDIDAGLLAGAGGADTIALANGCVCCSTGGDLTQALLRLLAEQPPFDGIVVEASGVGDPWRIAQYALADPALRLDAVVVLGDASVLAAQQADPLLADTLQRQLRHADLVVLNKTDLATAPELQAARDIVAAWAPTAVVLDAVQADVPVDWLGQRLYAGHGGWPAPDAADHGGVFEHWTAQPGGLFDAVAVRGWLQRLPAGVLRLKGLLPTAQGWIELQYAGRHAVVRDTGPPAGARPAVVAIGLRGWLPGAALQAGLEAAAVRLPIGADALARRTGG